MLEKHAWRPVSLASSAKPSPRWGHSCCVIGQELVLFGGYADSIYMNDLWTYNTNTMMWTELKTSGEVPAQRSNSSLHYDAKNNRVIMYGGGGANKTRFSSLHLLDWDTKAWTEINPKQNEVWPWERTYHSSQLLYPYFIVYGGEGVADLDDIWAFNIETGLWRQIIIQKEGVKPCGRRFHSSCLIGNTFYVIAGCYGKYRPLNDVFCIDLTMLVEKDVVEGMKWVELLFQGSSFLTRWGHACASLENKIYIFGGRFSNDLNDILVFDIETSKAKTLKTPTESMPKPRRRACINFVGSCMLMFGGFNEDYFNDLHFINVSEGLPKPKKYLKDYSRAIQLLLAKQTCDLFINCEEGISVGCHLGLLMTSFHNKQAIFKFIKQIDFQEDSESINQLLQVLYRGYGKCRLAQKYRLSLAATSQQKQSKFLRYLEGMKDPSSENQNIFSRKSSIKAVNSNLIELSDEHFDQFLEETRNRTLDDLQLVINNQYCLRVNSSVLKSSSQFFRSLLSTRYLSEPKEVKIWVPNGNVVLLDITLNFLTLGWLIVTQKMTLNSWFELYQIADYLVLSELKSLVTYIIWTKVEEATLELIMEFAVFQQIQELSIACARYKLRSTEEELRVFTNKHIQAVYNQNKFEIKQKMMTRQAKSVIKNKNSDGQTAEGEKENYETYNQ